MSAGITTLMPIVVPPNAIPANAIFRKTKLHEMVLFPDSPHPHGMWPRPRSRLAATSPPKAKNKAAQAPAARELCLKRSIDTARASSVSGIAMAVNGRRRVGTTRYPLTARTKDIGFKILDTAARAKTRPVSPTQMLPIPMPIKITESSLDIINIHIHSVLRRRNSSHRCRYNHRRKGTSAGNFAFGTKYSRNRHNHSYNSNNFGTESLDRRCR
jgi:hypothetical protein